MDLYGYRKTLDLKDGRTLTVRLLRKEDEQKLWKFCAGLPSNEVARMKEDIKNPEVIKNWIYDLDYDTEIPLVALDGDRIVAHGICIFNTIGWTRHQGEIRAIVAPGYRKNGFSTVFIGELIGLASEMGLEQLSAEVSPTLDHAYFLCEKMGFRKSAVLKDFIKDQEGNYEDLVIMVKDLLN